MNYFRGKQPRSYWLQVLIAFLFFVLCIAVFVAPLLDFQRNTQKPSAQEWHRYERLETSPDAVLRPRSESKVVTPVQEDHSLALEPVCRHSRYFETGPGLAVQWYLPGLSDQWVKVDSYWRCEQ